MNEGAARNRQEPADPPDPRRWRIWLEATSDLVEDWAALLIRGFGASGENKRLLVRQELGRYARFVMERELERRGVPKRAVEPQLALLAEPPPDGAGLHLPAGCGTPGPGSSTPECAGKSGGDRPPGAGALQKRAPEFDVTPEMFERFARVTGVESAAFSGSPDHVAGLVLYVVVFSLLTCEGDPPDLELQRLLKKLRLCREQLVEHAAALFGRGPLKRNGVRVETRLGADPTTRWLLPGPEELRRSG